MLMRTAFGEFARSHRADRGLRLRDVAERSGLSIAYVSELERGRKEPSSEVVAALCDALDVPLSRAMRDIGDRLALDAHRTAAETRRTAAAEARRRHLHLVPEVAETVAEPAKIPARTTHSARSRASDAQLRAA